MKNKILALCLLLANAVISQEEQSIRSEEVIEISQSDAASFQLTNNKTFLNASKAYDLLVKLQPKFKAETQAKIKEYSDDLNKSAIILVRHTMTKDGENKKEMMSVILHKENDKWSKYLLKTKKIIVIFIGGSETLQDANVEIEKQKSSFYNSFQDLMTLTDQVLSLAGEPIPVRFIELDEKKIISPCKVQISHPGVSNSLSIDIHEKSHFALQAGIGASNIDRKTLSIDKQQLVVTLDTNQKKEWSSKLVGLLVWYPFGQDVDRLEPIWKRTKEHKFLYDAIGQRIGLFTGLQISKDPISGLYGGFNFAISKDFYLNCGVNYVSQLAPAITNIGNITNLDEAKTYGKREYRGQLFIGVSFSPSEMLKIIKPAEKKK